MVLKSFCDKIFIISLKDRQDRQKSIEKNLLQLNLKKNKDYRFWLVDKHPKGSVYGSYNSHISIINYSLKKNYDNVLILEDDAYFDLNKMDLDKLREIKNFLVNNHDWDLFYLGGMITYKEDYLNKHIIKGEWILVHSYIINKKCMKYISEHKQILPDKFCFTDYYYTILNKLQKYGLNETICFQTDSPSTNQWPIYLIIYKYICKYINRFIVKKTEIYVMIIIMEFIFNLVPVLFLKKTLFIKKKYNNFRYNFYKLYGKNIPAEYFLLIPPL